MEHTPSPPNFISTYAKLPESLFRAAEPLPVAAPNPVVLNDRLAAEIGVSPNWLHSTAALQVLSGNQVLPDVDRLAMAYAGHQFGQFVPSLGDGRAALLGEIEGQDGRRRDLHLKGSGRTKFSRGGDGRATLSAMLREYIISEAMAALGIPTTRSLAVIASGEWVPREKMEQGAVLTRIAKSHVRVGTFQYLAVRGDVAAMQALADYELQRNFTNSPAGPERFVWFLRQVIARQAKLIASWMSVGFIHGVMNTDNMSVAGETIDYGPCAFMDGFDPQKTFSSIDRAGRYAWDKQPVVALWNLTRLAEALLPLFGDNTDAAILVAEAELKAFMPQFEMAFEKLMLAKLGITDQRSDDAALIAATLQSLTNKRADFTAFFSSLTEVAEGAAHEKLQQFFMDPPACEDWISQWQNRLGAAGANIKLMQKSNPFVIARNHRVEQALAAANAGDMLPLHRLLEAVATPFDPRWRNDTLAAPPHPDEEVQQTFCGT